jgi:transcriptional regulator with XRE-family HTH domain
MSDRDTFGPRLRSERERRGISLETISVVTNVSAELWEGLERNDFSRWPSGIFARAFIRDYARAVGLDPDEVVADFCRLFPIGDRRGERLIKGHADLIGHSLDYTEPALPPEGDRRSAAQERREQARARRIRVAPRALAAVIDFAASAGAGGLLAAATPLTFLGAFAATLLLYHGACTIAGTPTPGTRLVGWLRQRVPELFTVEGRAHA